MQLRPYQTTAIERLRDLLRQGMRKIVLVLPTGGGKTVILAAVIASFLERSKAPAIVIVHRKELVDQTLAKLASVGVEAGVVMGSDKRTKPSMVQVCSIQTLQRRLDRLPPAGLVVYDEVHHSAATGAREVLAHYPDAIVIGCTATPWRADKLGLADIFQGQVTAATPAELIALGFLVPADCYAYDAPDLHDVGMVAGDFNQKELGLACNTSVLVGSCVSEYVAHANGRRAICFPVNCDHSRALVAQFCASGFQARHVDWSTPADERAAALRGLADGSVQIVSSVGVLTEGFDCPVAEVAILARPTRSLGLFIQMVGRVLRPASGKASALIHDHGGNLFRHGFPDEPRDYSLKATPQRVIDLMSCTDCGFLVSRWRPDGTCPKCGSLQHMPIEEREAVERARGKDCVQGTRLDRVAIERIRNQFAERGRTITRDQAVKIANATREEKAAEYLRLCQVRDRKGFKQGFVSHQFKAVFGHWPRFKDEEMDGVQPSLYPFLPLPPRRNNAA